jgi:hypothetical protein
VRAASDAHIVVLVSLAIARGAAADSHSAAEETFERGRELMKQQKFAEACAAFEQSHHLDPQLGTLFNLADCEVELGKLATAWNRYRELARADPNPERRAMSAKLAESLGPRVPKLLIRVNPSPDGASLTLDGRDWTNLVGVETPIDLGKHEVIVSAPGFQTKTKSIEIDNEGKLVEAIIRLKPANPEELGDGEPVTPPTPSHRRATYAKIAWFSGGALLFGGLVIGGITYSTWNEAQHCTECDRPATSRRAILLGNVSTALALGSAVPIGIGVYLWSTRSSSATVTARVDGDRAGLALAGTF